jgi:hypothetical protein
LELSKENTNCCALPEISTRKVIQSNYNYICVWDKYKAQQFIIAVATTTAILYAGNRK